MSKRLSKNSEEIDLNVSANADKNYWEEFIEQNQNVIEEEEIFEQNSDEHIA